MFCDRTSGIQIIISKIIDYLWHNFPVSFFYAKIYFGQMGVGFNNSVFKL